MSTTRRQFLTQCGALGLVGFGGTPPWPLLQAAEQAGDGAADRVLVVIQLAGGNDGLNTVVPYADDAYHKARPGIGLGAGGVLKLNDQLGFHPSMTGMKELFDEGHLQVVQGVGYPNPDRSHFRSMDIWHTANTQPRPGQDGWLGTALAKQPTTSDIPALTLGLQAAPWALQSSTVPVASIRDPREFSWQTGIRDKAADRAFRDRILAAARPESSPAGSELEFVRRVSQTAYQTAERLQEVARNYQPATDYPSTQLGQRLRYIAQLINADLGVRVFFVSLDGFDTHSQQANAHQALLAELSNATQAFVRDMVHHKQWDRVALCTFSEFGRRVKENGSLGTDHGAASQLFVMAKDQGGIVGEHPSLTDLEDGDLKFHTDFRSVYAAILDQWFQLDPSQVIGPEHQPISLLS